VIKLSELRTNLSNTIENLMEILAPNLKNMLTAIIGARLIAKAGSLLKLAQLPSSTIQIIGAEKALFRALKTGTRPPNMDYYFNTLLSILHQNGKEVKLPCFSFKNSYCS
jgi:nucleolar protein 56